MKPPVEHLMGLRVALSKSLPILAVFKDRDGPALYAEVGEVVSELARIPPALHESPQFLFRTIIEKIGRVHLRLELKLRSRLALLLDKAYTPAGLAPAEAVEAFVIRGVIATLDDFARDFTQLPS